MLREAHCLATLHHFQFQPKGDPGVTRTILSLARSSYNDEDRYLSDVMTYFDKEVQSVKKDKKANTRKTFVQSYHKDSHGVPTDMSLAWAKLKMHFIWGSQLCPNSMVTHEGCTPQARL